jgi:hypothetical protein
MNEIVLSIVLFFIVLIFLPALIPIGLIGGLIYLIVHNFGWLTLLVCLAVLALIAFISSRLD